jgi:hypothetical protein
MSCIIAILLLAVDASANADISTLDKMVNRAKLEENLEKDLDETVMAKDAKGPTPKPAPAPKKKTWSFGEAKDIADKVGVPFDPKGFFRAAPPKLINEELAGGEVWVKTQFQKDGKAGKAKAFPGAPAPQYNPRIQQGFAPQVSMKMPNTMRGPRVKASPVRAPFLASVDAMSVAGVAIVAFFVGCSLAYFFHLRSHSSLTMTQ